MQSLKSHELRYHSNMKKRLPRPFFCVSCMRPSYGKYSNAPREAFNCFFCNATSRERSVILGVMKTKKFYRKRAKRFVGISDGAHTEKSLTKKYGQNYKNFQYHMEPNLDITRVPLSLHSTADLITCSEVLEHVEPPIATAFLGLYLLLKPGGTLILSVPHTPKGTAHQEHFPILKESQLLLQSIPTLQGVDENEDMRFFQNLVFHGGIGSTLEYRIFSEDSLRQFLDNAGFVSIKAIGDSRFFGVTWEPWSRVWTARKPNLREVN